MSENPIIKLENVWKIYQLGKIELVVLKDITLDIPKGGFVVILGPSGSGKSTMLNMVGCLDLPTRGRVFLDGKDIAKISEDGLAQARGQKIGFIFQQFNLLHNLSALENVMIPMIFQGKSEAQREERARYLLSSVDLSDRADHKPSELSGGEQQRIAIARALANNPEIIVADEPTGNLDSFNGKKIMEILIDLHKNYKKTIIVVTHDPTIADYSTQVVHIKDGRLETNHFSKENVLWSNNK
ncbi:MAG: ABC transporter ATP-binding protein [Parcubacteria group bacterium]